MLLDPITKIIGTDDSNIHIVENFLDKESFYSLQEFCDFAKNNLRTNDHHVYQPLPNHIRKILDKAYEKLLSTASEKYALSFINDGQEVCFFVHPEGSFMKPHTDIVETTDSIEYDNIDYNNLDSIRKAHEDHEFHWTGHLAMLVYINDDYDGGELYFPNRDISIKPKPNMMVCFPGNDHYLHGVSKNTKNVRFNISLFLKFKDFMI